MKNRQFLKILFSFSIITEISGLGKSANAEDFCTAPHKITANTNLKENCEYNQSFNIASSNVVLDCKNAVVDGNGLLPIAIYVGDEKQVTDVTIKNCRIRNFKIMGILVQSRIRPTHITEEQAYNNAPRRVVITDSEVSDIGNTGIFIGNHVTDSIVQKTTVSQIRGPGIYLEFSSQRNKILQNTIKNNGIGKGNYWPESREGLAIDSSPNNLISGNHFSSNGLSAISLYRNCGENLSQRRPLSSEHNILKDNFFENENVGVWIAQRQSQDQSKMKCSEPYYAQGKYVLDSAPKNTVERNNFENVKQPIIIEDDENQILSNNIENNSGACFLIRSDYRQQFLNRPIIGTVIENNDCPKFIKQTE